jgi:hypothetical protein
MFFVLVVPFFALSQISKARRSLTEADFNKHRRLALILNCLPWILSLGIGLTVGILASLGVIDPRTP